MFKVVQQTTSRRNFNEAKLQIKRHESCRLKMYKDSKGINTIGWGFNLDANEIP